MRLNLDGHAVANLVLPLINRAAEARERLAELRQRYLARETITGFPRTVGILIFPHIFFAGGGVAGCDSPGYQSDLADVRRLCTHPLREWAAWLRTL